MIYVSRVRSAYLLLVRCKPVQPVSFLTQKVTKFGNLTILLVVSPLLTNHVFLLKNLCFNPSSERACQIKGLCEVQTSGSRIITRPWDNTLNENCVSEIPFSTTNFMISSSIIFYSNLPL